jgi:hypothetical protein
MILVLLFRGHLQEAFFWVISYNLSGLYVKFGLLPPSLGEFFQLLILILPIFVFLLNSTIVRSKRAWITWEFRLVFYMGFAAALAILPRWGRFHVASALPFLVLALVITFKIFLSSSDRPSEKTSWRRRAIRFALVSWVIIVFLDIGMFYPCLILNRIIPNFSSFMPFRSSELPKWFDKSYQRYMRDMPEIGKYLNESTDQNERIFTWGWELSQVYLESDRLPAGRFYYALPWFIDLPVFERDLNKTLKEGRPRYIIETKKNRYPGTPALRDLGIDLNKMGYSLLLDMGERFPEVNIWKKTYH